jgi:uncharacterized protein DUF4446
MLNSLLILVCLVWLVYLTFLLIKIKKNLSGENGGKNGGIGVALNRFNPFGNVGGDQSFCLALLIRRNLGIIITSLHGRNGTRIYAREFDPEKIDKKKMSPEEKEAIKKALKIQNNDKK